MNCDLARDYIMVHIETKLDVNEKNELLNHLDCCKECMEIYNVFNEVNNLEEIPDIECNKMDDLEEIIMTEIHNQRNKIKRMKYLKYIYSKVYFGVCIYTILEIYRFFSEKISLGYKIVSITDSAVNKITEYTNVVMLNLTLDSLVSAISKINIVQYMIVIGFLLFLATYNYLYQKINYNK